MNDRIDGQNAANLSLTEGDLLSQIRQMAEFHGWSEVYHTLNSRGSDEGFPDLVMLKDGRQVVAELKVQDLKKGRVSAGQERWLNGFRKVPGCEVFVWRPSDRDEADSVLAGDKGTQDEPG
jgi:hypothetical protein